MLTSARVTGAVLARVAVAARGVVTSNTLENSVIGGMPGRPLDQWRRIQSLINRLEELFERVKRLETNHR